MKKKSRIGIPQKTVSFAPLAAQVMATHEKTSMETELEWVKILWIDDFTNT